MKYKIACKSLLLQKALENFLEEYLSDDGVLISDYDGDIIIGKDIKKPFTKSQLLIQLEAIAQKQKIKQQTIETNPLEIDMSIFEEKSFDEKLDELIEDFSNKLKKLIKEEYGKK